MCPRRVDPVPPGTGERRPAAAPEPGDTVGSLVGAQKPHTAVRPVPPVCASSRGRIESGGVRVPATDCESARPAGEVCGEKERRKVSTEQPGETVEGRESYSGENVDPTGEVAGDCQVRRDQVSRAAVSVSERQVSETGTVGVTGERVEQTELETSENPSPEQRRSKCKLVLLLNSEQGDRWRQTAATVTATTPTTATPHRHTQSARQDNLYPITMFRSHLQPTKCMKGVHVERYFPERTELDHSATLNTERRLIRQIRKYTGCRQ